MSPQDRRTQVLVAVIGVVGALVVVVLTIAFSRDSPDEPKASTPTGSTVPIQISDSCNLNGVIVQSTVQCNAAKAGPTGAQALRVDVERQEPGFFDVAFARDPGLPAEQDGYDALLDAGGIDLGNSIQRVTLANRSDKPVLITGIHVQIVATHPAPSAALAYEFHQGGGFSGYVHFAAQLDQEAPRSSVDVYRMARGAPGYARQPPEPPAFQDKFLTLPPNEIEKLTVQVAMPPPPWPPRLIEYRYLIDGETAQRQFTIATPKHGRVTALPRLASGGELNDMYAHTYIRDYLSFIQTSSPDCEYLKVRTWYAQPKGARLGTC
jgi:hypothetical protein